MTELLQFSITFQEPTSPHITELALKEASSLKADIARQEAYFGREAALQALQTPHSQLLVELPEGEWRVWFRELEGQTVVDLGCGVQTDFRKALAASRIGKYIGVDLFLSRPETSMLAIESPLGRIHVGREGAMPSVLIEADMLDVVSRLPDESCSFTINGVDGTLVDHYSPYGEKLVEEIHRATMPGGSVLGAAIYPGILSEFGKRYGSHYNPSARSVGSLRLQKHLKKALKSV